MRELFDFLDRADPWAAIAIAFAFCWVLEAIMARRRERLIEGTALLRGYNLAIRHAQESGHIPPRVEPSGVPESFERAFPE